MEPPVLIVWLAVFILAFFLILAVTELNKLKKRVEMLEKQRAQ